MQLQVLIYLQVKTQDSSLLEIHGWLVAGGPGVIVRIVNQRLEVSDFDLAVT